MRGVEDVEVYKASAYRKCVVGCPVCSGKDLRCDCRKKYSWQVAAYEACIPQDFWWIDPKDIKHNKAVFDKIVVPYVNKLNVALKKGYGIVLLGDNGVGKTYFISYILMQAIRRGRSAYYTTMPDLEHNFKKGFDDKDAQERLEWMLISDFLAIDELGKERVKRSNIYMDQQVERMIKSRLDDNFPMILSSNLDAVALDKAYGATVASMLAGKFKTATMEPGDFRIKTHGSMAKEMGYGV